MRLGEIIAEIFIALLLVGALALAHN